MQENKYLLYQNQQNIKENQGLTGPETKKTKESKKTNISEPLGQ